MKYYQKPFHKIKEQADFDTKTPLTYYNIETMDLILKPLVKTFPDVEIWESIEVEYDEKTSKLIREMDFDIIAKKCRKRYKSEEEKRILNIAFEAKRKLILIPVNISTQILPKHWTAIICDTENRVNYTINTYPGYGKSINLTATYIVNEIANGYKITALNPVNDLFTKQYIQLKNELNTDINKENMQIKHEIIPQQVENNQCGPLVAAFLTSMASNGIVDQNSIGNAISDALNTPISSLREDQNSIVKKSVQVLTDTASISKCS